MICEAKINSSEKDRKEDIETVHPNAPTTDFVTQCRERKKRAEPTESHACPHAWNFGVSYVVGQGGSVAK